MSKRKRKIHTRSSEKTETQTKMEVGKEIESQENKKEIESQENKKEIESQENKKKNKLEIFKIIITVIPSLLTFIVSLLGYLRSGETLTPKYSLEVLKTDENDSENMNRIFKIYNVGGQIVNPKIDPMIQLELICISYDENGEADMQGTVVVSLSDYFTEDYSYNNSESAFIIQEKKANELYDLIDNIDEYLKSENVLISYLSIKYYFEISYFDYKGKEKEKILYPTINRAFIDYINCKRERYFEKVRLEETDDIKECDILCPMSFEYKNGAITMYEGDEQEQYFIEAGEKADGYLSALIQYYFDEYSIELEEDEASRLIINEWIIDDSGTIIGFIEGEE